MSKKFTIEVMQEIAKDLGGKCLSKRYKNSQTKLQWQCKEGHVWEATPNNVRSCKWCPFCAGNRKLTIEDMQEIAKERGGKCLSKRYKDSRTKLRWQCKEGHVWSASRDSVKQGKWCPKCGRKKAADSKKLPISVLQAIAKERDGKCLSKNYVEGSNKLSWQCQKGHNWEATPVSVKSGSWCPVCAGNTKSTISEMQSLANERGGKCLSKKYVNTNTKLRWQCSEGHIWEAVPDSIKRGTWCPSCGAKRGSNARKLTIKEMREIAKQRGGKCLSKNYVDAATNLRWKCEKGHVWEANPGNIKYGQWCPVCGRENASELRKHTIEYMQEIAEKRSGSCLSEEYVDSSTKLLWQCIDGHTWWTKPAHVLQGHWCPECAIDATRKGKRKKGRRGIKVLLPSDFN